VVGVDVGLLVGNGVGSGVGNGVVGIDVGVNVGLMLGCAVMGQSLMIFTHWTQWLQPHIVSNPVGSATIPSRFGFGSLVFCVVSVIGPL
jgi:hypothetical protein